MPPPIAVSANELRVLFEEGKYLERIENGELTAKVLKDGPARRRSGEPAGTRSQIVGILDSDGLTIAIVHQYRRPDGTLGASGKPDPKKLVVAGQVYILEI